MSQSINKREQKTETNEKYFSKLPANRESVNTDSQASAKVVEDGACWQCSGCEYWILTAADSFYKHGEVLTHFWSGRKPDWSVTIVHRHTQHFFSEKIVFMNALEVLTLCINEFKLLGTRSFKITVAIKVEVKNQTLSVMSRLYSSNIWDTWGNLLVTTERLIWLLDVLMSGVCLHSDPTSWKAQMCISVARVFHDSNHPPAVVIMLWMGSASQNYLFLPIAFRNCCNSEIEVEVPARLDLM